MVVHRSVISPYHETLNSEFILRRNCDVSKTQTLNKVMASIILFQYAVLEYFVFPSQPFFFILSTRVANFSVSYTPYNSVYRFIVVKKFSLQVSFPQMVLKATGTPRSLNQFVNFLWLILKSHRFSVQPTV
jgi:hypothetical protein